MTPEKENSILWYLIGIADEYGVPWMDYFSDEEYEYRKEIEPMGYWDAIMFLADKQREALMAANQNVHYCGVETESKADERNKE